MPLDEHTRTFLEKGNINPAAPPGSVPIETFREALSSLRSMGWDREEVAEVRDITVPTPWQSDVPVRIYKPETDGPQPLVVLVHGGSWVRWSVDNADEFNRVLANRSGAVLAAIDYSLAPESRFPTALEEVHAAARWLQEHADDFGCEPENFGIMGESSGGNLTAAATLLARDRGDVTYARQVLIIPLLAIRFDSPSWKEFGQDYLLKQPQIEWAVEQYAPGVNRSNQLISPLLADDVSDLPPALIVTAEYDPLRSDGEDYAERLREAGVPVELWRVPGLIHHTIVIPKTIPLAIAFVEELADRVRATFAADVRV
jgi:acetyl esterase/lipase